MNDICFSLYLFMFLIILKHYFISGFPKVVPAPGTVTPPQSQSGSIRRQSRALECLAPPRKGSFRQRNSPIHTAPPDRPPLAFCRRRLSWPEVDPRSTSGYVFFKAQLNI